MKNNSLVKTLLVLGLGAVLAYFGLNIPQNQVEQVVEGVATEVGKQTQKGKEPRVTLENSETYKVLSVIDGDTLTLMQDGEKETVRVLGINTPETKYSSRGVECYGAEASAYAKTLLEGSEVTLEQDVSQDSRDKYNRILAYVGLADGRDFGQVMIADGYAYEYTFKGNAHKKQALYRDAQARADEEVVGLWGVCEG